MYLSRVKFPSDLYAYASKEEKIAAAALKYILINFQSAYDDDGDGVGVIRGSIYNPINKQNTLFVAIYLWGYDKEVCVCLWDVVVMMMINMVYIDC